MRSMSSMATGLKLKDIVIVFHDVDDVSEQFTCGYCYELNKESN